MLPMVAELSDDPIVNTVFDRLKRRWGSVLHLYRVLAWSPELVRAWAAFAWALRFEVSASRRLRELLIIRIAALLGAKYEYEHHLHLALDEGFTEAQIAALSGWKTSDLFADSERIVLALADDLALMPGAKSDTMVGLRKAFSERECVELLVTGAFYCGVARIINSAQIELEPGHTDLRPRND